MTKLPASCFLAVLVLFATADSARPDDYTVTAPPAKLKLPAFYKKYVNANGYPVVSSAKVSDYALKETAYLINLMLAERPDVRKAMVASGSRMIVMAYNEFTTEIPEHSKMKPKDFWDARARGLGGSRTDPVCSCAEENVLGYPGDHYDTESIVIHEFAHNIHLRGLVNVDPTFDDRLKEAYKKAMAEGLWKNKYSSTNHAEYWAEGVQSWFDNNRPPDHDHNHVDTRKELKEYDPRLAKLCEEVFGNTKLTYTKPATRLRGHLAGYDPKQAPTFRWPKRLDAVRAEIKRKARNRGKPVTERSLRTSIPFNKMLLMRAVGAVILRRALVGDCLVRGTRQLRLTAVTTRTDRLSICMYPKGCIHAARFKFSETSLLGPDPPRLFECRGHGSARAWSR